MFTRKLVTRRFPVFLNVLMVLSLLAGGLGLPSNTHALGLAIEVNTTADNTIKDGRCSLREAIINANRNYQFHGDCTAGFSDDGIFFSNALGTATITLNSVLPTVKDFNGLVIDGGGDITISGNDLHQVFQISATGVLTLDNLTVRNGNSAILGVGGGAWNIGVLTINKSSFLNNKSNSGAGVYNARTGNLTVLNSNFSGNHADVNGGGVFNEGGLVSIQNGSFTNNEASTHGGGIYTMVVSGFPANPLTISGTKFITNGSSFGGAIYSSAAFTITDAIFTNNSAWYGGGIYNDNGRPSTILGSSFTKNVADYGAGIYNIKGVELTITSSSFASNIGDGIHNEDGTILVMKSDFTSNRNGIFSHANQGPLDFAVLRVWDSTFSKNRASGIYNDFSGTNVFTSTFIGNGSSGIHNINKSVVTVDRSTFRGNVAENGGAIYNERSDLHLRNSTLTENKASYGGGLYNTSIVEVINTTFADNTAKGNNIFTIHPATQPFTEPTKLYLYNTILTNPTGADDCQDHNGMVDGNNNLIRSNSANACGLIDGLNSNMIGFDPDLGTLIGSPAYYPLNTGSLAIDAGDDAYCAMLSNQSQNGVIRPQGVHCDIGSYEMPFTK